MSPYTELVDAKIKCLILFNLDTSNILKKPSRLFLKYVRGFLIEYLTPACAARLII